MTMMLIFQVPMVIQIQGDYGGCGPGLGQPRFGMFQQSAWAVGSWSNSPPALVTTQISFKATQVRDHHSHTIRTMKIVDS